MEPVIPFEPVLTRQLPEGRNWIAQIKWDGVRMLTYCDGQETRLINRRLNDKTRQYPEFTETPFCTASSFILDGEIIAFDEAKPSFHEIMKRDRRQHKSSIAVAVKQTPATYMIFDILFCNGRWVTEHKLSERQIILEKFIKPQGNVQMVQSVADSAGLLEVMKSHGMEGIVCKDLDSVYGIGAKDNRWQKKKLFHDLYAVIGGVTYRDQMVNSLLLGLYVPGEPSKLMYIGHAGTGKLTVNDWRALTETVHPLILKEKPFANKPERSKDAIWLKPTLTVKVQFLEWTPGGTMRHPSIQSLDPVAAEECTFGQVNVE